ncbi:hypothetical protein GUITHDRAFT_121854 [Guillardia theta CCMP2712]|uniref:PI31 proteasome regulator N-terminal domain-containing protein n=1 Tax=Guillardia theta (strain CCMP2712) TaxID=905079 RepID=L1I6V7_GUITC|nr:hypothetical protein GUITHDRAFT_121854 [Guillardia theta CCMP2712]EKX31981.1 hypothetical protein GUITHDRAFT_121854 [Guillardia theta CCMP2712]|eukprot:XP_005818961.1 hypothetical protein GUITHDRAFT_121854 [Guillardia theta CCMP2712]
MSHSWFLCPGMEALKSAIKQLPEKGEFTSEADALAFAVHACLEKDGFRFVAAEESRAAAIKAAPSTPVPFPSDWNGCQDAFSFFYRHASSLALFTVKCVTMEDLLLVHAASDNVQDVFFLELRISDFVQTLHSQRLISDYEKIYTDLEALLRAVRINITYKLLPSLVPKKPSSSQHGCAMQAEEVPRSGSFPWRPEHVGHPGGLGGNLAQVSCQAWEPREISLGLGIRHSEASGPWEAVEVLQAGQCEGSQGDNLGARVDPFGPPGVFPNPNGPAFGWTRREIPDDIFQPPGGDDMFM